MERFPLTTVCAALLCSAVAQASVTPSSSWTGQWSGQNAGGTQLTLAVTSKTGAWQGTVSLVETKNAARLGLSGVGKPTADGQRLNFDLGKQGGAEYSLDCQRPTAAGLLCELTVTRNEGQISNERVRRLNLQTKS